MPYNFGISIKIDSNKATPIFFSTRLLVACLIFCGVAAQYMQKIDMSIGIVCMVKHNDDNITLTPDPYEIFLKNDNKKANITCLFQPKNGTSNGTDGPFDWSKSVQGMILSSYFYGYILSQVKILINLFK